MLAALIILLAIVSVLYRAMARELPEAAALFIGLPTVLAVTVALSTRPTNFPGLLFRYIALVSLTLGIVFAQPYVCAVLALSLFHYFSTLYPERDFPQTQEFPRK